MNHAAKTAALFVTLILLGGMSPLGAIWIEDGVPVCTAPNRQYAARIVADGSGGHILIWADQRDLSNNTYAQRIDATGTVQWTANGVPVCISTGGGNACVTDGAGGAIITWSDNRATTTDIYAQRIDEDGIVQWTVNGIPVCQATGNQSGPQIVPNGDNRAIITWMDLRNGTVDFYAQMIDATGSSHWTGDGVPVCVNAYYKYDFRIIADGDDGAIVIWGDERSGNRDIFAQKIDAGGAALWAAEGEAVCTAADDQIEHQLVPDGAGGAIIAWQDITDGPGNPRIYAQRIDANGDTLWDADGVYISTAPGVQGYFDMIADGVGGMIITWGQEMTGIANNVFAQRVDADGNRVWAEEGVVVCSDPYSTGPRIATDGAGGAVIAWLDWRTYPSGEENIYAQRIDNSGVTKWIPEGVPVCLAEAYQSIGHVVSDDLGGAVISWVDFRAGTHNSDVYVQWLNGSGQWVTLLRSYSTEFTRSGITVVWELSQAGRDMLFFILRKEMPEGMFREVSAPTINSNAPSFSYTDETVEAGARYIYRIDVLDEEGRRPLFETEPISIPPMPTTLCQNHPNPFNPVTVIEYYLPERCDVSLEVFDAAGRLISVLVDREEAAGRHHVVWNGFDGKGNPVASGSYLYRLTAGKKTLSRKMIVLR